MEASPHNINSFINSVLKFHFSTDFRTSSERQSSGTCLNKLKKLLESNVRVVYIVIFYKLLRKEVKRLQIFNIHFIGLVLFFEYSGYFCLAGIHRRNKKQNINWEHKNIAFR